MSSRDAFNAAMLDARRGHRAHEYERVALDLVGAAADLVAELDAELATKRSEVIKEVTGKWQWGAWYDVLLPASKPPAVPAIDYAQRVTEWLRDQAEKDGGTDG